MISSAQLDQVWFKYDERSLHRLNSIREPVTKILNCILGSNGGNVFKFHTPPQSRRQLRDAEVNDHIELRPMLSGGSRRSDSTSGHESDSDAMSQYTAVPSSRPVIPTTDSRCVFLAL